MSPLLFVPGRRKRWSARAVANGLNGVTLDLEGFSIRSLASASCLTIRARYLGEALGDLSAHDPLTPLDQIPRRA